MLLILLSLFFIIINNIININMFINNIIIYNIILVNIIINNMIINIIMHIDRSNSLRLKYRTINKVSVSVQVPRFWYAGESPRKCWKQCNISRHCFSFALTLLWWEKKLPPRPNIPNIQS